MTAKQNTNAALAVRPATSVNRWDPWTEMAQTRTQMDDLFSRFFGYTPLSRLMPTTPETSYRNGVEFSYDLYEASDELVFIAPLPGINAEDLNIEATANALILRGERKPFYTNENATLHRQGWWSTGTGAFQVSFTLPIEIDPNNIQANYRSGVLELHLPKSEAARPKTVKVNVSNAG